MGWHNAKPKPNQNHNKTPQNPQTNKPTHHTTKLFYSSALLSNSSTQHPSLFSYELSFVAVNFKILYFKTLHTECAG